MLDRVILEFTIDYFKANTNKKQPITNQKLDQVLQDGMGCRPFSEGGIRALIHQIRVQCRITDGNENVGWICGNSDGYYLSYSALDILTHLTQFEGKIRKMMKVHKKGMETLMNKMYYTQTELEFKKD